MSFGLLTPLALGLGALVGLPILAHLARQTPRDRQAFGAMLLLERVMKRLRRRRRLKDPLVLLLRALALLALALAAAGPRFSYPGGIPEHGAMGKVVLVIDRSLSMSMVESGNTLLGRARDDAERVLAGLPAGTQVGLVVFDDRATPLTTELTDDHARIANLVRGIQPTHGTSDLKGALHGARTLLGGEPGEVLVFSDEAGPTIVKNAQPELEALIQRGSTIIPMTVRADPARNVAITSAVYGTGLEGGSLTLRLANYGPDAIEVACEVTLPDGQAIPIFAELPPSGEAEERLTIPPEALGGVGKAVCNDPDLPADDAWFFHLPRVGASRVLVVDGDPGDTPTRSEVYFLERALAPWGGARTGVSLDVTAPGGVGSLKTGDHRVVFLANVADPRPLGPLLTEFVAMVDHRPFSLVVLAPQPTEVARREEQRAKAGYGTFTPEQLDVILRADTPRLGYWLDSTDLTVDQTVDQILANLDGAARIDAPASRPQTQSPAAGVRLRPVQRTDLRWLAEVACDPSLTGEHNWGGEQRDIATVLEELETDFERGGLAENDTGTFIVCLSDGTRIGDVSWRTEQWGPSARSRCPAIGINLLPEYRGRGLGTAAQRLIVDYLFERDPLLHRVQSDTAVDNPAERRALAKIGMIEEGLVRSAEFRGGRFHDHVLFSVLRSEWSPNDQVPNADA